LALTRCTHSYHIERFKQSHTRSNFHKGGLRRRSSQGKGENLDRVFQKAVGVYWPKRKKPRMAWLISAHKVRSGGGEGS